ncbi:MAG: hypothetical protein PWQ77_1336 [Kosmotogales bacterium]|nr:hypothetical protein [Kosmotogales bacterium]
MKTTKTTTKITPFFLIKSSPWIGFIDFYPVYFRQNGE